MKLSRHWISDYIDLGDLSNEELSRRFTEIGHAVESVEPHGDDTIFDLEITTNRVDAMSHLGMARELAAALGRELRRSAFSPRERGEGGRKPDEGPSPGAPRHPLPQAGEGSVPIRIEAADMCSRYTGLVIRGVNVKPSPEKVRRRLEAVGLRPINNVVDATNYVMMAIGHPLHAFDLDKLAGQTIIVRRGKPGETMRSLDGEMRKIDPDTVVIADAKRPVALGGIIGGAESEIGDSTRNVLLECAWFNPSVIRRTARRLGIRTDASYRFERRVDPNDTVTAAQLAADLIVQSGAGAPEPPIDAVAAQDKPKTLVLRDAKLREASAGVIAAGYALELFRRLGFEPTRMPEGILIVVPAYRGDIHEEMDLSEEVLRFYGLNNVPAELPRLTTGDTHTSPLVDSEDAIRGILMGCGLTEAITYSFIRKEHNALFSDKPQVAIANSLSENITAMRLSMLPGLLEVVAFNRSYGTRDGALFEVGRVYERDGERVRERHRIGIVMYGSVGGHWGDAKRPVDFFDLKGVVEQVAKKLHVDLEFIPGDEPFMKKGRQARSVAVSHPIATLGHLTPDVLQTFGVKGDVLAAEVDVEALLASASAEWKMAPVARFPGIPMVLGLLHGRDLQYERIVNAIRSLEVPFLHDVGVRDRFVPEGEDDVIKTTLGMWYQAFDRSLTQEEVGKIHQQLATRVADLLPVKLL